MWVAVGALVVSVVAVVFAGISLALSRAQKDASLRQADAAEAQTEYMRRQVELMETELERLAAHGGRVDDADAADVGPEEPAPVPAAPDAAPSAPTATTAGSRRPRPAPWLVTHLRGDRYHLTNGSPATTYDVVLETPGGTPWRWDRVGPADPTPFRSAPRAPGVVVRWRWSPEGPRHEWTGQLPDARR